MLVRICTERRQMQQSYRESICSCCMTISFLHGWTSNFVLFLPLTVAVYYYSVKRVPQPPVTGRY